MRGLIWSLYLVSMIKKHVLILTLLFSTVHIASFMLGITTTICNVYSKGSNVQSKANDVYIKLGNVYSKSSNDFSVKLFISVVFI